jgi:hypothetical protein
MDERVMEEEGKDRKRKRWEIGKKRLIFGIVIFMFVIKNPKSQSDKTKNFFFKIQALYERFLDYCSLIETIFRFPVGGFEVLEYGNFYDIARSNEILGWKRRWKPSIVVLF